MISPWPSPTARSRVSIARPIVYRIDGIHVIPPEAEVDIEVTIPLKYE